METLMRTEILQVNYMRKRFKMYVCKTICHKKGIFKVA